MLQNADFYGCFVTISLTNIALLGSDPARTRPQVYEKHTTLSVAVGHSNRRSVLPRS